MSRWWTTPTLLLLVSSARAQEGAPAEMVTDRPDQTESAIVLPRGTFQFESGVLFVRDGDDVDRLDTFEAGGTLVRIGLSERIEARLGWAGEIEEESRALPGTRTLRGGADPEIGMKGSFLALSRGDAIDLALLAHLSIPAGSEAFGSPRADPSIRLLGAHELSERAGLGWNVGCEWASFEAGGQTRTLSRYLYTAALGVDLAERWGAFVELFGDFPASDRAEAAHSLDAGLTFLATERIQLDLAAGVGLSEAADDFFVGVGLSFRVPR